jgi:hypothetical protein
MMLAYVAGSQVHERDVLCPLPLSDIRTCGNRSLAGVQLGVLVLTLCHTKMLF